MQFYNSNNGFPDLIAWQTSSINMTGPKVTRCQFHQHLTNEFFVQTLIRKLFSSFVSSCVFASAKNLYKKCARVMLMKLTAVCSAVR